MKIFYILLIILLFFNYIKSSTYSYKILGAIESTSNGIDIFSADDLRTSCFNGYGLDSCYLINNFDNTDERKSSPFYDEFINEPTNFCVKCCSQLRNSIKINERWDIQCPIGLSERTIVNQFEDAFLFPRNLNSNDDEVISCNLKRRGCNYNNKTLELIGKCNSNQDIYLAGYKLTLEVEERTDLLTGEFWISVQSCELKAYDSYSIPTLFNQTIIFKSSTTYSKSLSLSFYIFIFIFLLFFILCMLKLLRVEKCLYCGQRLWLLKHRCIYCRIYGCEVPEIIKNRNKIIPIDYIDYEIKENI